MKKLNPKQLFYFGEVYKRGSVNAVADHLNMVQAGIGRQIQLLEEELGVQLFERGTGGRGMVPGGHGRGMVPTEAAEILYDFYCRYRDWQQKLETAIGEWRSMKRGDITIAMLPAYIESLVEEVLNDFHDKHPSSNVCVKETDNNPQIINKVLKDETHIGIIHGYFDQPDIRYYKRALLPMCMLVNQRHPLAINGKRRGALSEIASYPFMLPSVSYIGKSLPFAPAAIVDSFIARKRMAVTGNKGVLMSTFAARQEISAGQLIPFEVDHPAFTSMEVCLIVRRGRVISPAANQLLRLIAKMSIFCDDSKKLLSGTY